MRQGRHRTMVRCTVSRSEGRNPEETACRLGSEPSAEVSNGAAGIAPNDALSKTTVDKAGVVTGLRSGALPSCSECGTRRK